MRTRTIFLSAVILATGLATATADTKRINKGRAGYSYRIEHRAQATQKASTERPKTVGLMVDRKARTERKIRQGGRAKVGLRPVRR